MKFFLYTFAGLVVTAIIVVAVVIYLFYHYGQDLPDHKQLAASEPATMTRVHAGDGRLVAELATLVRPVVEPALRLSAVRNVPGLDADR